MFSKYLFVSAFADHTHVSQCLRSFAQAVEKYVNDNDVNLEQCYFFRLYSHASAKVINPSDILTWKKVESYSAGSVRVSWKDENKVSDKKILVMLNSNPIHLFTDVESLKTRFASYMCGDAHHWKTGNIQFIAISGDNQVEDVTDNAIITGLEDVTIQYQISYLI